ncbi:putative membrane protein, partial [Clostridioides difficile DA00305]
ILFIYLSLWLYTIFELSLNIPIVLYIIDFIKKRDIQTNKL